MTEEDWATVLELFRACRSRRGDKGRNDRRFLEALHYFCVHNITWRALPAEFGNWNSVLMVDSQTTNSALSATVS
jgi:transposase